MSDINLLEFYSVPFNEKGSSVKEGFNCYTLCQAIYKKLGRNLPNFEVISFEAAQLEDTINHGKDRFTQISGPQPFCLVTFCVTKPFTTHIGIVLGSCDKFIHIMAKRRVTVERLDHPFWKDRITGYYELTT